MIGPTWVLGDIHGNARGLRAALAMVDAAPAELVLLGDLLTYGPDVAEVVDLVAERVREGASLILGNHDELYVDLMRDDRAYYDGLPGWIRESVDWTRAQLDEEAFAALPFVREVQRPGILFSHGSPFDDWRYVNTEPDHREAGDALLARGFKVGVFGHTHRSRLVELPSGRGLADDDRRTLTWRPAAPNDCLVLNAGSVGQPRNRASTATLLKLDGQGDTLTATVHALDWDRPAHLDALRRLPLTEDTVRRLAAFFTPRA